MLEEMREPIRRTILLLSLAPVLSAQVAVNLTVQAGSPGLSVPQQFTGFSYEISSLNASSPFLASNYTLQRFIAQAGPGVLRFGGNSADTTAWTRAPRSTATPSATLTSTDVDQLFAFVPATGDSVLFAVNLANSTPATAADEASYVFNDAAAANTPLGFEIGNEPDLYKSNGDRATTYSVNDFYSEWLTYDQAITAATTNAKLTGPADSGNVSTWTVPFAQSANGKIVLLTQHLYPLAPLSAVAATASNAASIPHLLAASLITSAVSETNTLTAAAKSDGISWRMAESNSVYNGGQTGVSDVFAAALWGADYMFALASNGGTGINFHGGGSGAYTPIALSGGVYQARPLYYGMLLYRLGAGESAVGGSGAQFLPVTRGNDGLNLSVYAVKRPEGSVAVTLINKDTAQAAAVNLTASGYNAGYLWQLSAPAPTSTTGITLAGASVTAAGVWGPLPPQTLTSTNQTFSVSVPAASAAVVILGGTWLAVRDAAAGSDVLTASGIASAYGTSLTAGQTVTVADSSGQVLQGEVFATSGTQVNFQIPPRTANGLATVRIGTSSGAVIIAPVAPSIFTVNESGSGLPAAVVTRVLPDGTQAIAALTPAPVDFSGGAEVYLTLYGTGIRGTAQANVSCSINKTAMPVSYAGPQGSFDGLDQVNIALPATLQGSGTVALTITAAGRVSNQVSVTF
jgi:uncharacterized protein (TIGR03437 family)